ncbi:MAG TPA: S8 family serine peptidase, partial [Vicinamibacterales bacterium]
VRGVSQGLQHANRHARGQAVVAALRDTANRSQGAIRAQLAQDEAKGNARKVKQFWVFNGLSLSAKESVIRKLAARDDVRVVRYDRAMPPPKPKPSSISTTSSADPAWNIDMIEAPRAWALGPNYDGTGVVIGSFDTGVDGTHPDLAPRYRGNDAISWFDPYGEHASPYDNNGHGTHTTGTVVGGDLSGNRIGVAPGAKWIAAKGWDDTDNATVSSFHEIFQWFLAPGGDPANAPQVVNNSWGDDTTSCDFEFRPDVQAFRAAGILPVFAAGNSGPDPETVLSPGAYAESYAVGATDFDDNSSFFSSEGPSPCTGAVKPNISAPGEFILSTWLGGDYQYLDGTSMATPHVTGAAAVLLSIDPTLTVDELEAMLSLGSVDLGDPGPDNAYGDGRLDVFVSAEIALGLQIVRVVATTPTAYEAGTVPGVITVSRFGGDNTAPLTLTYTVGGNATSGADYVALPGSVTIPSGASSATIVVTPVDDNIYELDETVVVTLDASPAYATSQPTAIVTIVSDDLPPDLIISAMSAPATGGAGATISVTDTTKNQGTGFAQATTTRYYLSTNNVLDASDVMLGGRAVPALAPGASNTGTVTLTIPASTAGGTYYLFSKADADDVVLENHETNNLYATNITIGADLVISAMSVPTDAGAGFAITVSDTTKNQGSGIAGASTTTYYLSADGALDPSDVVLGSRAVGALASGASDSGSISVTIPSGTAAGTYYVYAKADAANVVGEVAENNNTASRLLRIGPDLLVTTLSAPSAAGTGATITVTDTTKNQGAGAAPASTTRYYLSTNNLFDAGDVLLGSRSVGALAPGASST